MPPTTAQSARASIASGFLAFSTSIAEALGHLEAILNKAGYFSLDLYEPEDQPPLDQGELWIGLAAFRKSDRIQANCRDRQRRSQEQSPAIRTAADAGHLVIAHLHHHHWRAIGYSRPTGSAPSRGNASTQVRRSSSATAFRYSCPSRSIRADRILHSLGNFIFHSRKNSWKPNEVWESVVGVCSFDQNCQLTSLTLHPGRSRRRGKAEGRSPAAPFGVAFGHLSSRRSHSREGCIGVHGIWFTDRDNRRGWKVRSELPPVLRTPSESVFGTGEFLWRERSSAGSSSLGY